MITEPQNGQGRREEPRRDLDPLPELHGASVVHTARQLGLRVAPGPAFGPCPCCGSRQRGGTDARPPCGVKAERWHCHVCKRGGNAGGLVAAVELGEPGPADRANVDRVRARAERAGLLGRNGGPPAVQVPSAEPARPYPPALEVARLWQACRPVERVEAVCAWLAARGLDARGVALHDDYARVCPAAGWPGWPSWARTAGQTWGEGWRLVLPAYGVGGKLVTLRARWTRDRPAPGNPAPNGRKEVAPAGFAVAGACYATIQARALLDGESLPAPLVVVEGGPAWLRYALEAAAKERPPAVVGMWAGSWSDDVAARLAGARRWIVATDNDPNGAGDRYAGKILALARRLKVDAVRVRWKRTERGTGPDDAGLTLDDLFSYTSGRSW